MSHQHGSDLDRPRDGQDTINMATTAGWGNTTNKLHSNGLLWALGLWAVGRWAQDHRLDLADLHLQGHTLLPSFLPTDSFRSLDLIIRYCYCLYPPPRLLHVNLLSFLRGT